MQTIVAAIGSQAWAFAKLDRSPPSWYPAALQQAHGEVKDVSCGERLLLARFIYRLPCSSDKEHLIAAFLHAFLYENIRLEDAICLLEFKFQCKFLFYILMLVVL